MQNIELNIKKFDKYFITPNYDYNFSNDYFNKIEKVLDHGVRLLQFRSKNLNGEQYTLISKKIYNICSKYNSFFFINDLKNFNNNQYCDGIHLTSANILYNNYNLIPETHHISVSCHNKNEINICNELSINFVLISPVLDTGNKIGLGWEKFKMLASLSKHPVFALGGMNYHRDIDYVKRNGGHGLAAISYFYHELFDA